MFYSQFILAKKGPLGTIWIAAHLERKLRKNQVADTDIGFSVDSILFPDVPIALRLSSHLLLGVVRIYSRKVNYLFDDCSEALLKIKQAFRSTAVDLPPEESTAPYHSITLPETFDLDDFELPDNEMFQGNYVDHHISTKEQITLQDTMDGVVYSTSQFGLDERFGEGDASQIGLDIDGDLFMGNVAAKENDGVACPMASAQQMTPGVNEIYEGMPGTSEMMQENEGDNQSEIPAASKEALEHLRSPFTPGFECPSPLDYETCPIEAKDHMLEESEAVDHATHKNNESDAHDMASVPVENGFLPSDIEKMELSKSPVQSVAVAVDTANVSADPGVPTPSSDNLELVKPIPELPECSHGHIGAEDGQIRVEDMHKGDVINNDPSAHLVDRTDIQFAESPSCSQVTTEMEDPGRRTCSADGEIQNNMGESCSTSNALTSNICPSESPDRPEVVNAEARAFMEPKETENLKSSTPELNNEFPVLRACSSVRQPDMLPPGAEGLEPVKMPHTQTQDGCQKLDEQMDNAASFDRFVASELPAPEKLLSVAEGFSLNNMSLISTPEKEAHENALSEVGNELLTGKKRSYMESNLTVHSLNSGDSFSMNKSRRTAESVPGDDDLLSSILVGRKSSVLKLKPTPPVTEIISTKRQRSAPRASASKRKVLMDDMMVLHGDTIRQQLTNTEDIRRLRKKAPCTRPEIAMIQRQFLEEAIFSEPIFTGMSVKLVSLHSEAFDLSRILVCKDDAMNAHVEMGKDGESSVLINAVETRPCDICIEGHNLLTENIELRSQEEILGGVAEMEIDLQNFELANTVDHPVLDLPVDVSVNAPENVLQIDLVDRNNDVDAPIQMDPSCMSPQTFDTELVDDTTVAETSKVEVTATEVNENDTEVRIDVDKDEYNLNVSLEMASEEFNLKNENQTAEGIEIIDLSIVNPDVNPSELGFDEKDVTPTDLEGVNKEFSFSLEFDANGGRTLVDKEENVDFQEQADLTTNAMNADIAAESSAIEFRGEYDDVMAANDTDFLNVDDDDVDEDNEDLNEGAEDTRLVENTGWSSRTRAVSKYLQILFEKEPVQGKRVLAMDNLLTGKTRKEASRMFFETLVLKTKDYIHVEQAIPFDGIKLKPRIKLMKSDF